MQQHGTNGERKYMRTGKLDTKEARFFYSEYTT
jgi:hypothetical protein